MGINDSSGLPSGLKGIAKLILTAYRNYTFPFEKMRQGSIYVDYHRGEWSKPEPSQSKVRIFLSEMSNLATGFNSIKPFLFSKEAMIDIRKILVKVPGTF